MAEVGNVRHSARNASRVAALADSAPAASRRSAAAIDCGVPSDLTLKALNAVHRLLLRVTGGRIGREFSGMPVLELVTTSRRRGVPRAVMLTSPLQEGGTYVVVASRGGDDRHPAWFLNLRDNPRVHVSAQGGRASRCSPRSLHQMSEHACGRRSRSTPATSAAHSARSRSFYCGLSRSTTAIEIRSDRRPPACRCGRHGSGVGLTVEGSGLVPPSKPPTAHPVAPWSRT